MNTKTFKVVFALMYMALIAALLFALGGCNNNKSGESVPMTGMTVPELGSAVGGVSASAAASGSLYFVPGTVTAVIEGARRSDFRLELWDKGVYGTTRPADGTPLAVFAPLGNGTYAFDVSAFACYDLQADLGSADGGLLASKQLHAWGQCPVPPPTRRRVDVCPNLDGVQESVPEGYYLDQETGLCVRTPPPPPEDMCLNLEGIQETVPEGYYRDEEGNCFPVPPPPPTDLCPNIEGVQETVPDGYYLAEDGNCYPIVPPPPPDPGLCYYRVSCGGQQDTKSSCDDRDQQLICEAAIGGDPAARGVWTNFESGALHNHCRFTVPGLVNRDFQLNPGQSDAACLNKKD